MGPEIWEAYKANRIEDLAGHLTPASAAILATLRDRITRVHNLNIRLAKKNWVRHNRHGVITSCCPFGALILLSGESMERNRRRQAARLLGTSQLFSVCFTTQVDGTTPLGDDELARADDLAKDNWQGMLVAEIIRVQYYLD